MGVKKQDQVYPNFPTKLLLKLLGDHREVLLLNVMDFPIHIDLSRRSGRVLDSRWRGRGFEPYRRHCVVSFGKTHLSLLSTGSTQEDPSQYN